MPDLHDELERLAARVSAPPSTEDLQLYRERLDRRRSRAALAVGVTVAILGTVVAFTALRPADPRPAIEPTVPAAPVTAVVWPENVRSDGSPEEAQARVDAGEDRWRLDPEEVARRFARSLLGWSDVRVVSDPVSRIAIKPCVLPEDCGAPLTLEMAQPARQGPGGIWSVASVHSSFLTVDLPTTESAPLVSEPVRIILGLPENRRGHVGIVATNGCHEATTFEVGLLDGPFDLAIPEQVGDDPACADVGAGYVFAYVTDDTTVPVGDPLLEAAAIEYPWLTIVPITLTIESAT